MSRQPEPIIYIEDRRYNEKKVWPSKEENGLPEESAHDLGRKLTDPEVPGRK